MRVRDILRKYDSRFEAWAAQPETIARGTLENEPSMGADWDIPELPNDARTAIEYARLILDRIVKARDAIARNQLDLAARAAVELGYLIGEADAKTEWRKIATIGARSLAGARVGAKTKKLNHPTKDRNRIIRKAVDKIVLMRKLGGHERASPRAVLNEYKGRIIKYEHEEAEVPSSLRGAQKAYGLGIGKRNKQTVRTDRG